MAGSVGKLESFDFPGAWESGKDWTARCERVFSGPPSSIPYRNLCLVSMTTKTLQALVQNQIQSSAKLSQRSLKDFRDPETSVVIYKRREKQCKHQTLTLDQHCCQIRMRLPNRLFKKRDSIRNWDILNRVCIFELQQEAVTTLQSCRLSVNWNNLKS